MSEPKYNPLAPRKPYAADAVFKGIAGEILRGELAPGDRLPPERVVAERFSVSTLIVRHAMHRLAELGLVDARQGLPTRVCSFGDAPDLRIIELYQRLAPAQIDRELAYDVLEKQYTQGLALVEVFTRRASVAEKAALVELAEGTADAAHSAAAFAAFEERFWTLVAESGGNRILVAEVRWWYTALPARPTLLDAPPLAQRYAFYVDLARRLRDGNSAIETYREQLGPGVARLAQRRSRRQSA